MELIGERMRKMIAQQANVACEQCNLRFYQENRKINKIYFCSDACRQKYYENDNVSLWILQNKRPVFKQAYQELKKLGEFNLNDARIALKKLSLPYPVSIIISQFYQKGMLWSSHKRANKFRRWRCLY